MRWWRCDKPEEFIVRPRGYKSLHVRPGHVPLFAPSYYWGSDKSLELASGQKGHGQFKGSNICKLRNQGENIGVRQASAGNTPPICRLVPGSFLWRGGGN